MRISKGILLFVLFSCSQTSKDGSASINEAAYRLEIDQWHAKRIENLKSPTGWLNLAGLFWLKEGINTFGSSPKNDIVFPEGKIAERAGFFLLKQGVVTIEVVPKVEITTKGRKITNEVIFHPDSSRATLLEHGSLQWVVIKRDNQFGVRLRYLKSAELENFHGIERYPVDVKWRLTAKYEKANEGRTIDVTNVLGQTTPQESPGTLKFTISNQEFKLDALDEGGDELFIIFGDQTNARETYGSGRYMYVKKPDEKNEVILDFNKAYNPPCAFTPFATCPLPPRQNVLSIEITAGEKNYGTHQNN